MVWLTTLFLAAAPVGFDAALARVESSPELTGVTAALATRQGALPTLSRFTSNPQVTLEPGLRHENGALGADVRVGVSQAFNLGGLSAARRGLASEEAREAAVLRLSLLQQRRLEVARAWLDTWVAQQAARAAHDEQASAQQLLIRLARAVTTGAVTKVDVATARAFAAELAAVHLDWEGRRIEAGAALSTLLGFTELATAEGPLPQLSLEALAVAPDALLEVRAADAALRAEAQRAEETKALWAPQLLVTVLGGHEAPRLYFGAVALGFTLPLLERGNRERSVHAATQQRLEGQRQQALQGSSVALQVAQHDLEHSQETFEVVHGTQWPAAEEAARLETLRYQQGETTLLELTLMRRQAFAAHLAALAAEASVVAARVRARELTNNSRSTP